MSKENSPEYQRGLDDGRDDALALSGCPPGMPLGPQPKHPKYPVMYMTGYNEAFQPSPCDHTGNCQVARERQKAVRNLAQELADSLRAAQNRSVGSHNTGQ